MKLFNRQKSQPVIPPELLPYYETPASTGRSNRRRFIIAGSIVLVVVVCAIVATLLLARHQSATPKIDNPAAAEAHTKAGQTPQTYKEPSAGSPDSATQDSTPNQGTVTAPEVLPAP